MNILIVDDEKEIREGLSFMIQQLQSESFTPTEVCTAADGKEAFEKILAGDIHLVITDIRMPVMDGIQLLEKIKSRQLMVQSVVLSGFDDFPIVQQALRYNAADYLLKPVRTDELQRSLLNAYERRNKAIENYAFSSWEAFLSKEDPYRAVVACGIDAEDSDQTNQAFYKALLQTITDLGGGLCVIHNHFAKSTDSSAMIGGYSSDPSSLQSLVEHFIGKFSERMKAASISVSFGSSECFKKELSKEMFYPIQACGALLRRMIEGSGIHRPLPKHGTQELSRFQYEKIFSALNMADFHTVVLEMNRALDQLLTIQHTNLLQREVEFLLLAVVKQVYEHQDQKETITAHEISQLMTKLLWSRNSLEYKNTVLEGLSEFLARIAPQDHGSQVLQRAKQFVKEHYGESLTLAHVSSAVYVSPSYLGLLFREEAGTTFLEYLTSLRISEAKRQLAQPGVKIYEVAEKIGYGSWKHFSRVFKKATGYNPVEYRKNAMLAMDWTEG